MMAKRNNTVEFPKRLKVAAQNLPILFSMILYYLVPMIFFVYNLLLNDKILIFWELNGDILFHNSLFNLWNPNMKMVHCIQSTNCQSKQLLDKTMLHCIWQNMIFLQCMQLLSSGKLRFYYILSSKYFHEQSYLGSQILGCNVSYRKWMNRLLF